MNYDGKIRPMYNSLDEMAKEEGVMRVLEFLASNPTEIFDTKSKTRVYIHTNIKTVNDYTVQRKRQYMMNGEHVYVSTVYD